MRGTTAILAKNNKEMCLSWLEAGYGLGCRDALHTECAISASE